MFLVLFLALEIWASFVGSVAYLWSHVIESADSGAWLFVCAAHRQPKVPQLQRTVFANEQVFGLDVPTGPNNGVKTFDLA